MGNSPFLLALVLLQTWLGGLAFGGFLYMLAKKRSFVATKYAVYAAVLPALGYMLLGGFG